MRSVFLSIISSFAVVLLLASCNGNKGETAEAVAAADSDSLPNDSAVEAIDTLTPPPAADGLFDDFVYSFMHNRRFQLQRIKFPLPNVTDGKAGTIAKEQWKFDPLYARQTVYTMLFDNEKSINSEKNTKNTQVIVEWIYLDKSRVKQYRFNKEEGKWLLTGIDNHALEKNVNNDFFNFYRRFATDTRFQMAHIADPISFKTYDSDTFQKIDGVLDARQWPDFRPSMPAHVITNINYGQKYAADGRRVLVITSPSAGMSCTLKFQKKRGTWLLTGMESI